MTLLEQLDRTWPTWRVDYNHDPLEAALDLGLIEPEDISAATDYRPINLHDEAAAWGRVEQNWKEEHGEDDYEE